MGWEFASILKLCFAVLFKVGFCMHSNFYFGRVIGNVASRVGGRGRHFNLFWVEIKTDNSGV